MDESNIASILGRYYSKLITLFRNERLAKNVEFEAYPFLFVIYDYAVYHTSADREISLSIFRRWANTPVVEYGKCELRVQLYGKAIGELIPRGFCSPTDIFTQYHPPIARCGILFCDILVCPECVADYEHTLPPSIAVEDVERFSPLVKHTISLAISFYKDIRSCIAPGIQAAELLPEEENNVQITYAPAQPVVYERAHRYPRLEKPSEVAVSPNTLSATTQTKMNSSPSVVKTQNPVAPPDVTVTKVKDNESPYYHRYGSFYAVVSGFSSILMLLAAAAIMIAFAGFCYVFEGLGFWIALEYVALSTLTFVLLSKLYNRFGDPISPNDLFDIVTFFSSLYYIIFPIILFVVVKPASTYHYRQLIIEQYAPRVSLAIPIILVLVALAILIILDFEPWWNRRNNSDFSPSDILGYIFLFVFFVGVSTALYFEELGIANTIFACAINIGISFLLGILFDFIVNLCKMLYYKSRFSSQHHFRQWIFTGVLVIPAVSLVCCVAFLLSPSFAQNDDPNESPSYNSRYEVDDDEDAEINTRYVLNTDSMKIHKRNCASAKRISDENKGYITDKYTVSDALDDGYTYCGNCLD